MLYAAWSSAIVVFVLGMTSVLLICVALFRGQAVRANRLTAPQSRSAVTVLSRDRVRLGGMLGWMVGWQMQRVRAQGAKPALQKLRNLLAYAGFEGTDKLVVFRLIQLAAVAGLALAGALAAVALQFGMLTAAAAGALLGYTIPMYALGRMVRIRQRNISRELPPALDLLTVCLEAGMALSESLKIVARESLQIDAILGSELAKVVAELGAGVPLETALRNFGERTGVDDVRSLSALVIQSEKMGTRLGPALRSSADLLVARRRLKAEENAQKSAIKTLLPLVLLILPAMIIVILGPAVISILHTLEG
jgi:tight adherence protein C